MQSFEDTFDIVWTLYTSVTESWQKNKFKMSKTMPSFTTARHAPRGCFPITTKYKHCRPILQCICSITCGRVLDDFYDAHKNILNARRNTDLSGNQLNAMYVGVQRKIQVAPSTAFVLVAIPPHRLFRSVVSRGLQNSQLNLRRRNLIIDFQVLVVAGNRHRDFQHGVTSARSKCGFQIVY